MARLGFIGGVLALLTALLLVNFAVQFVRKPAELISMLSFSEPKTPYQTWATYKDLFEYHSTSTMSSTFLAAMAQAESAGNPFATPKWRFKLTDRVFSIFSPTSTSVGLYQFTNGTFDRAKKYCVRGNQASSENCWLSWFNWRVSASDSIEVASAYLTSLVTEFERRYGKLSSKLKRRLAAVIHLCGLRKGQQFIKKNFSLYKMKNCGSHNVANYVNRIESLETKFAKYSMESQTDFH